MAINYGKGKNDLDYDLNNVELNSTKSYFPERRHYSSIMMLIKRLLWNQSVKMK